MRGAWIEMMMLIFQLLDLLSLPMRGAWIEMILLSLCLDSKSGRSPCGERGLKFAASDGFYHGA